MTKNEKIEKLRKNPRSRGGRRREVNLEWIEPGFTDFRPKTRRHPPKKSGEGVNPFMEGDNKEHAGILIDYNKLCDAIYVSDWF